MANWVRSQVCREGHPMVTKGTRQVCPECNRRHQRDHYERAKLIKQKMAQRAAKKGTKKAKSKA